MRRSYIWIFYHYASQGLVQKSTKQLLVTMAHGVVFDPDLLMVFSSFKNQMVYETTKSTHAAYDQVLPCYFLTLC